MLPNLRMPMLLPRVLSGLLLIAAGLPCQKETEDVKALEDLRRAKAAIRGDRGAAGEMVGEEKGDKGDADASLTPEERLARNITSGAHAYCRLMATVKPDKLLPGQTGIMTILATMQGEAVLPAPPPVLEVVSTAQQGEVSIGSLSARPAANGRHARGYLGRPVYDNYALLDVPVTMSPNAQMGSKHVVAVELKFDLYDGNSAQAIGRFLDRVQTTVEVGKALDPAVQGGPRPSAGTPPPTAEPNEPPLPEPASASPKPAPEPKLDATVVTPTPPPPTAQPVPAAPLEGPGVAGDEGGLPVPLLIGGGMLLLAVIVLLARRR